MHRGIPSVGSPTGSPGDEGGEGLRNAPDGGISAGTSRLPASGNGPIAAQGCSTMAVWALRSEPGEVRPHNEDYAVVCTPYGMCGDPPPWTCGPCGPSERFGPQCAGSHSNAYGGHAMYRDLDCPDLPAGPPASASPPGQPVPRNESTGKLAPLFVVADGLGGHNSGEVASKVAADTVIQSWQGGSPAPQQALRSAARRANAAVFEAAFDHGQHGMATTLTALALVGNEAIIAHIGDSRAYLVRHGRVEQITTDHSQVAEMLRRGLLTPEQAANHPARSVLTRCIGMAPAVSVDMIRRPYIRGDIFVLCSDGLWDMVSRQEIGEAAAGITVNSRATDAARILEQLVNMALSRGAPDNVTAMIVLALGDSSADVPKNSRSIFRRWTRG
ncbi:MAG: protein phosphatase 2C domain-containing protein [Actinobacteria bacterium]|nr:protein phosphatase 2C domain-containing protein [Actinomycetota bacterium]MCL5447031.1 protein phosphatase 2C domain-containing protein [Actinomycetota bacterium]